MSVVLLRGMVGFVAYGILRRLKVQGCVADEKGLKAASLEKRAASRKSRSD